MFAKLFESEKYGQILVMKAEHDDTGAPQVRFVAEAPEPFGISHVGMTFEPNPENGDEAEDKACEARDVVFDQIDTLEQAEVGVKPLMDAASDLAKATGEVD